MYIQQIYQRRLFGLGAQGKTESSRIRDLRKSIVEAHNEQNPIRVETCPAQIPVPEKTTQDQFVYLLDKVVCHPILFTNPDSTVGSQPVYTAPIPPLIGPGVEPPQGPAVSRYYRNMSRISSTDEITRPAVTRAASYRISQIQASIASSSQTRYVQVVIPIVNPACRR